MSIKTPKSQITPDRIAWRPNPKLTKKTNSFIKQIVDNPKISATQAMVQSDFDIKSRDTARMMASEYLAKPNVLTELSKYSLDSELTLIKLMNTSSKFSETGTKEGASYATVALNTANSILDRLHGKATQTVSTSSTAVTLNIDLTGTVNSESHNID